jgi:Spy/CpxP family protein refolding chaperone
MLASVLALPAAVAEADTGTSPEQMQEMMQQRGGYGMGMGPGTMGGGMGMGPGMMGGSGMMGMGAGMMGGGMMGLHGLNMLDLSDEQRGKINAIHDKLRKQHWEVMGKMMDEHNALRDLYDAETLDGKKIGATYDRIFKLKRQMIDTGIKAHNDAVAVLTKEQREQLKQLRRGRGMGGPGMGGRGPMGQGGMMGR